MKKNFFSLILILLSVTIFVYLLYKSEIIWVGNNRNYYYPYFCITLFLMILSLSSLYMSRALKTYFFISTLSIFFSLYAFESYLLIFKDSHNNFIRSIKYKITTGRKYENRTKYEIYTDLKKLNSSVAVNLSPSNQLFSNNNHLFRLSGKSKSETIYCNENGYYSMYESDRFGFNNPDSVWDDSEIEYILIGDSFTHGACVNSPFDIASKLRILSKKPVINLGYGGNGPLIELATLREYYPKKFKKIIWFYYEGNDNSDFIKESKNKILINYLKDFNYSQNLKNKQGLIDKTLDNLLINYDHSETDRIKRFNKINKFIKLYHLRSIFKYKEINILAPDYDELKNIFKMTKRFASINGAKLYFVYLPSIDRYKSKNFSNENFYKIKNLIDNLNISFIDINKKVFSKRKDPINLFPNKIHIHYNAEGYEKIANAVYKLTK